MESLKHEIHKSEPELADVLVPNCIYRAGCPEFKECGYWTYFEEEHGTGGISERYENYNNEIYKEEM